MANEETIKTLIQTAKEFQDQVDIALIHNGSVTGLWLRTAEALEEVVRKEEAARLARDSHYSFAEQFKKESDTFRAALVKIRDLAEEYASPGLIFEIADNALKET